MIRIYSLTHRETCLDLAQPGDADEVAYDEHIDDYFAYVVTEARQYDLDVSLLYGRMDRVYQADTEQEHAFMMALLPFWEWYQGLPSHSG